MTWKRIVLVFHILAAALAAGGLAEEGAGCLPAGASRCDPSGRHLSVCLGPAGWRTAVDCAKDGRRCEDGRCLPTGPEERSGRANPCIHTDDDNTVKCGDKEVWFCGPNAADDKFVATCPIRCEGGQCVGEELEVYCDAEGLYPSLTDSDAYYDCRNSRYPRLVSAVLRKCDKTGQNYDSCLNKCREFEYTLPVPAENELIVWPYNHQLYYFYKQDVTLMWFKCSNGMFDGKKCTEAGYECPADGVDPPTNSCADKTGPICNPKSNCNFYYCNSDGTYKLTVCQTGYHYAESAKKCISGNCTEGANGCKMP